MTGFFVLNPFVAESQGFTVPYPAWQSGMSHPARRKFSSTVPKMTGKT